MIRTLRLERGTRSLLLPTFGALAGMIVLLQFFAYSKSREIQSNVDILAEDALTSIELVERMDMTLQRKRDLIDQHILERRTVSMDQLEKELTVTNERFAAAARLYEPLVTFPNEANTWHRLQEDVASTEGPIQAAVALSRANQGAQAREAIVAVEPRFDAIDREVDELIDINLVAGDRALAAVRQIQRSATRLGLALALLAACVTLVIGLWVTRLISRGEVQIKHAAAALESRNRELDAFAGRVAHDLRGPLSVISLSAARLSQRQPEEEGTTEVLRRGVARMETLIEDLLKLSRIDAQVPGTAGRTENVAFSMEGDLGPKVKEAEGVLRIEVEPAKVGCSEGLLREALWNLGENAVKYRRVDVQLTIDVTGRVTHRNYEFRVSDNGRGMSHEETRQAFDPFFRGAEARSAPGTGLGLSIVKRIIEASGGTVSIESEAGKGTLFLIRLPLAET